MTSKTGLFYRGCRFVFLDLRDGRIRPMAKPDAPLVMCLGNFDGVHLAHAQLLCRGRRMRDNCFPDGLCGVFTFFRPSFDYFASVSEPRSKHLTTLKEKLRLFANQGMDFACLCDFAAVKTFPAEIFLTLLSEELGVSGVVCGFNFRFGAGGTGNASLLSEHFDLPLFGKRCEILPPYLLDGEAVSSTRIRHMLLAGETEDARRHLGRPYVLESRVVHGKQLGRSWGFPTANQFFLPESLIPAHGVYAVLCHTPDGVYAGVSNIGSHPTVDHHAPVNCETHIIGYGRDLYGYRLKVEFLCRLREEMKFPSEEALRSAIQNDAATAAAYISAYLKEQV